MLLLGRHHWKDVMVMLSLDDEACVHKASVSPALISETEWRSTSYLSGFIPCLLTETLWNGSPQCRIGIL